MIEIVLGFTVIWALVVLVAVLVGIGMGPLGRLIGMKGFFAASNVVEGVSEEKRPQHILDWRILDARANNLVCEATVFGIDVDITAGCC